MELMEFMEMVRMVDEDLTSRGSLMKAAACGDAEAQGQLKRHYRVWVYSPSERDAFVRSRSDLHMPD